MTEVNTKPIITASVAALMYKTDLDGVMEKISTEGSWYFSHRVSRFICYIPDWDVNVTHEVITALTFPSGEVKFDLAPYSSVYEVTRESGYPSSVLLAKNLELLVEEHFDISPNLEFLLLSNTNSPVLLGNKKVLDRLVLGVPREKYFRAALQAYIKGREQNV